MNPLQHIQGFSEDLTAWRRDFHMHPEIGFEEVRTSAIVAEKLAGWGIEVHRGVGGTGVVGVLRAGQGNRSVGLRADMDALPMEEANDFAHRSTIPGRMHACGHDGHTTMLLGAARYLAETKDFDGTVHFIFQPAEEGLGGAQAMLRDGLFERFPCDSVFGLHNRPGMAVGAFGICEGPMMAGAGFFDIVISGKGGHGARPEAAQDPLVAACQVVSALQTIVARNMPPTETAVLSVTAIQGGEAYNVIPQSVALRGTIRAYSVAAMKLLQERMRAVAEGVATGLGVQAEVSFREIAAPLVNAPEETTALAEAAVALVGGAAVDLARAPGMGSEDFAYMMQARPGAYILVGNGDGEGTCEVHNPRYDTNDAALPYGAAVLATVAQQQLRRMGG